MKTSVKINEAADQKRILTENVLSTLGPSDTKNWQQID